MSPERVSSFHLNTKYLVCSPCRRFYNKFLCHDLYHNLMLFIFSKQNQTSIIHNFHHTNLFSIAAPLVLLDEHNWIDEPVISVWTVGQERLLLNSNLSSRGDILSSYPTMGGSVNCMQLSPLDPNR